jgi:hypothetical protein
MRFESAPSNYAYMAIPLTKAPSVSTFARGDDALNRDCACTSLDAPALEHALESELGGREIVDLIKQRCPHLFSAQPVFVSSQPREGMRQVVRAIESVIDLPAYREAILPSAPEIARFDPGGPKGVFFGYDFHVTRHKLGLIEVNTNAGGILLSAALARAQRACCGDMEPLLPTPASIDALEDKIIAMFRNEWRLSGRPQPLRTIAIVDEAPASQYLYAEFLLFKRLFERHGLEAIIADPAELSLREGRLCHQGKPIDLVYNRLTDFSLESSANAVLREAYLQNAVLLTPHPQVHALFADKRNFAWLGNEARLVELGVPLETRRILLASVPRTEIVDAAHADRLWSERRKLFFKPASGFGSRAAYRGDKITQRVWREILAGKYIAQEFIAPGERAARDPGGNLKFDVRNYVYDGDVQWLAARLYQGQTTNFRTPGGGFAPVYATDSIEPDAVSGRNCA